MKRETGFTNSAKFRCLENLQNDSVDLGLVECGMEECEPGYRFGPNGKSTYLLHVVVRGKGKLEMNQKVYPVNCGEAFLICPDEEAWYEADLEEPWFYIWVRFTGLKAYECVTGAGFKKEAPVHRVYCIDALRECVEKMLEAHQLTYGDELKRNGELMLFFSALIADYHQNILKGGYNKRVYPGVVYVKYAMEYISQNYGTDLKINKMADYIGVNRSYLTTCFKKEVGCSPQEYLLKLRMDKAASMLRKTDLPIHTVASEVGYSDPLAFSKMFKQRLGMGPRAYREMEDELVVKDKKEEEGGNPGLPQPEGDSEHGDTVI